MVADTWDSNRCNDMARQIMLLVWLQTDGRLWWLTDCKDFGG